MSIPLPIVDHPTPEVALTHLDTLWFQVSGTVCNFTCHHCFISCSPHNHNFQFLTFDTVERYLQESVSLGVKEYYFTGGEPFLNPDMVPILERTLQFGPATVLTNGSVFKDDWLKRLQKADENSPYCLEFRVSLDGFTAADNDPIRGDGTFERTVRGIRKLVDFGFLPIITITKTNEAQEDAELVSGFVQLMKRIGYSRPRLKVLPTLRIGAEPDRQRGYHQDERVTPEMMAEYDPSQLICSSGRLVSDRGVHVCPILLEAPDALIGNSLHESLQPYQLRHHACYTCYQYGALCSNTSSDWEHM